MVEENDSLPPLPFRGFDETFVLSVWELALSVDGNDSDAWRKDTFGAWMRKSDYGNRHSPFGWEVVADGGAFGVGNGHALQWQNYIDYVRAATVSHMTADGLHNVRRVV